MIPDHEPTTAERTATADRTPGRLVTAAVGTGLTNQPPVAASFSRGTAVLNHDAGPVDSAYARWVKPVMDRGIALILLVVLGPALLLGMLAVRLTLGRRLFFVQERVGRGGKEFSTYKLRTMTHDRRTTSTADLQAHAQGRWDGIERRITHKSQTDPRMNKVGSLLRTFSVDEIPQLFNVLKGDMSLVGPRPELPMVVEKHYEPWMHRRHVVKPGLTGLWQVSERGNGMMHEHVDVDLDYVDSMGLLTDLRILLSTPHAALGPRRGY